MSIHSIQQQRDIYSFNIHTFPFVQILCQMLFKKLNYMYSSVIEAIFSVNICRAQSFIDASSQRHEIE